MAEITISLQDLGYLLIGVLAIILLLYLIALVKNLLPSVKSLTNIMSDAEAITKIARKGAEETEGIVESVGETVSDAVDMLKGNKNILATLTSLIKALTSLAGLLQKAENKKQEAAEKRTNCKDLVKK